MNIKSAKQEIENSLRTKVFAIKEKSKGYDHKIFIAATGKGNVVLRHALHDRNKLLIQKKVCELWKSQGIPVPRQLFFCSKYLIEEQIKGVDLDDLKLQRSDLLRVYSQLGRILKKAHKICSIDFGEFTATLQGSRKSWRDYLNSFVPQCLEQNLQERKITQQIEKEIKQVLKKFSSYLCSFDRPVILHGDLSPDNIMIYNKKVSGLIDTADALSGDPCYDLGMISYFVFDEEIMREVFKSYGHVDDKLVAFYALMTSLWKLAHHPNKTKKIQKKLLFFLRKLKQEHTRESGTSRTTNTHLAKEREFQN